MIVNMIRFSKHSRVNVINVSSRTFETSMQPSEVVRGSSFSQVVKPVVVDLSSDDVSRAIPLPDDYTLDALIRAGVPLREVSSVGLLSSNEVNDLLSRLDPSFQVVDSSDE